MDHRGGGIVYHLEYERWRQGGTARQLCRGMERVSVWARGLPVLVKFLVQRSPCCA